VSLTTGRTRRLLAGLALLGLVLVAAMGVWRSATAPGPQTLEARTQAIASQLRCPTCQNLSAADSPSVTALSMRDTIAEQLTEGRTQEEILDWFVDRYGPWILLHPRREGLNWALWLAPLGLLGLAPILIRRALRRPSPESAPDEADVLQVERLYRRHLDGEELSLGTEPAEERLAAALQLLATVRDDRERAEGPLRIGTPEAEQVAIREVLAAVRLAETAPRHGVQAPAEAGRRRLAWWGAVTAAFLVAVGILLPAAVGVRGVGAVATGDVPAQAPEVLSERLADGPEVARLREAVADDPQDAGAHRALADALADRGRLAESAAHYRDALAAAPDDARTRLTLGVVLLQLGAHEDVVEELRGLLDDQPDHVEGLLLTGLAQAAQGHPAGPSVLRRFLELAPPDHPGIPIARSRLDEADLP
jgi:cytochrome c-type biogenesis protein CcmH